MFYRGIILNNHDNSDGDACSQILSSCWDPIRTNNINNILWFEELIYKNKRINESVSAWECGRWRAYTTSHTPSSDWTSGGLEAACDWRICVLECDKEAHRMAFRRAGLSSSDVASDWSGRITLNNNLLTVHSPLYNSNSVTIKVSLCHYSGINYSLFRFWSRTCHLIHVTFLSAAQDWSITVVCVYNENYFKLSL